MQSCMFSIITQSSVSHDPSEIIQICRFAALEFICIFINVIKKKVVVLYIFVETKSLIEKSKECHLFEMYATL